MTIHFLESALRKTEDLKEKVNLYNRFFSVNRDDSPLPVLDKTDDALNLSHRSAYSRGIFETLIHRAYAFLQISEKSRAEEEINKIKQLYKEDSGWDRENMFFYQLLCLYYGGRVRSGLCSDYAYRCMTLSRKLGFPGVTASVQAVLGRLNYKLRHYREAGECYYQALDTLATEENVLLEGIINCHLGDLYSHTGPVSRARCYFHRGYDLIKDRQPRSRGYALVLRKFAAFEEGEGNLATAEYLYEEAVNSLEKSGYDGLAAEFRLGLGRLLLKRGDGDGLRLLNELRDTLRGKGLHEKVLHIGDLLSDYYLGQEDFPSAARELKTSRELTRELLETREMSRDDSFEKEQLMTARDNLTRVHSLGSRLAACQNRRDIFLVLRDSLDFLEEDDGLLVAEETSGEELKLIYGRIHGVDITPRTFPHDPRISMISYCLRNNQSLLIDDFEKERCCFMMPPGQRLILEQEYPPSVSLLNIIYERESTRGVISLQSTRGKAFRFHQLEFLQSLLPFLTVALDNEEKTGTIRRLSTLDSLTGLLNRREFLRVMNNSWSAHGRSGEPLSLLMLDIDHFKSVNDTYGHRAGDEGLIRLSRLLETHFKRTTDVCCRYGGEEFIILSGYTDESACRLKAEELRQSVEDLTFEEGGETIRFTISIGTVTFVPDEDSSWEDIIRKSDISLYEAKKKGRNRVVSYSDSSLPLSSIS